MILRDHPCQFHIVSRPRNDWSLSLSRTALTVKVASCLVENFASRPRSGSNITATAYSRWLAQSTIWVCIVVLFNDVFLNDDMCRVIADYIKTFIVDDVCLCLFLLLLLLEGWGDDGRLLCNSQWRVVRFPNLYLSASFLADDHFWGMIDWAWVWLITGVAKVLNAIGIWDHATLVWLSGSHLVYGVHGDKI